MPHHFKIPLFKNLVTHVSVFALEELFKQYKKAKYDIELLACKGHFSATMGLPCSHKIRLLESEVLDLVDINQQWRLDMRSFSEYETQMNEDNQIRGLLENQSNENNNQIGGLLKELQNKYEEWPLAHKEFVHNYLFELINEPIPSFHEPTITSHKGHPLNSKSKKESSSTKHDPSGYEIVDKKRKCGICKCSGHNSRTCQHKVGLRSSSSSVFSIVSHTDDMVYATNLNSPSDINNTFWC
ncbi:Protein FAR1-RELATED SEQUENCE 5 [Quillaja saponaria]|uniref:Protein FAR1-RELATED SEQUENCE 5 n=1 Tax=Quillaja saponaria TaxID=32244 RepID=A0AAD7L3E6_QUISA|nr:Protein FAR1-RELATED SEQUENCE 5 [Quillaja saponaria]